MAWSKWGWLGKHRVKLVSEGNLFCSMLFGFGLSHLRESRHVDLSPGRGSGAEGSKKSSRLLGITKSKKVVRIWLKQPHLQPFAADS